MCGGGVREYGSTLVPVIITSPRCINLNYCKYLYIYFPLTKVQVAGDCGKELPPPFSIFLLQWIFFYYCISFSFIYRARVYMVTAAYTCRSSILIIYPEQYRAQKPFVHIYDTLFANDFKLQYILHVPNQRQLLVI